MTSGDRISAHPLRRLVATGVVVTLVVTLLQFAGFGPFVVQPAVAADPPTEIALVSSAESFAVGATVTLTATTDLPVDGTGTVIEIVDSSDYEVLKTCSTGDTCVVQASFDSGPAHVYVARVGTLSSEVVLVSRAEWSVSLAAASGTTMAGQSTALTATANQNVGGTGGAYGIHIFDVTAEALLKTCTTGTVCEVDSPDLYASDEPEHLFVAVVAEIAVVATAEDLTDVQAASLSVAVARAAWEMQLESNVDEVSVGDDLVLTASVNQNLSATNGRYELYVLDANNNYVGGCSTGSSCVVTVPFTSLAVNWNYFTAYVATAGHAASDWSTVEIDMLAAAGRPITTTPWSVALSADAEQLSAGEAVELTVTLNDNVGKSDGTLAIYIFEEITGRLIKTCTTGSTCVATDEYYTADDPGFYNYHYYAMVAPVGATSREEIHELYAGQGYISEFVWVERQQWEMAVESVSVSHLRVSINQSVTETNGMYGIYLVQYPTFDAEGAELTPLTVLGSCLTGTRCLFGTPSEPESYIFAVVSSTPPVDLSGDWQIVAGAVYFIPPPEEPESASLENELRGGGNPSVEDCTCDHADPVDGYTGEFYLPATDLAISGIGPSFAVSRTYSSTSSGASSFGHGWSSNFQSSLAVVMDGTASDPRPQQVEVTQENGSTVLFTREGDAYIPPLRASASLVLSPDATQWTFTRNDADVFTFDATGRVTSVIGITGTPVTFAYDTSGDLATMTASGGRTLTFAWDGDRVESVTDSAGRTVEYVYDSAGDLVEVLGADGGTTEYAYDAQHRMIGLTLPGGATTTNEYDADGRVVLQTDPLQRETAFSYDNGTTTVTADDGTQIVEVYTAGLLTSRTVAAGTADAATWQYTYNAQYQTTRAIDPLGNVTTMTYDPAGNMLTRTDPLGRVSTFTYDAVNKPLTSTDPFGNVTTMTYDGVGNLLTATSPGGRVQSFAYNTNGTVASSTDPAGKVTTFTYDAPGRLASTTNSDGLVTSLTYDAAGNGATVTAPDGAVSSTVTDPVGRILSATDPLGRETSFGYNTAGQRTSTTDALGNVTYAAFDAAGQQTSTTDAAGSITQYTYTPAGQLATVRDAQNHVTTLAYNARGELLSTTDAAGRVTSQTYDLAGRVVSSTRPSGAVSTVAYDAAGQVTSSTDPGGFATTFTYTAAGKPLTVTDALSRVTTSAYGLDGEVTSVTLPDSSTQSYGYDAAGRATSFTNADGKVTTYSYGNSGQLLSKTEPGALTTSFVYDDGRLQSSTLPDATTTSFTYDVAGNALTADRSVTPFVDATFAYDALNRATSLIDPTGTSSFTYDSRGNLLSEVDGGGDALGYAYDSLGQLKTITYPGAKDVEYEYDTVGQLTSVTDWLDNESTFTWTLDGQLDTHTSGNGVAQSRDYDNRGHLTDTEVEGLTATLASFAYGFDAVGQLTSTETTLDGQDVDRAFEYDPLSQLANVATTTGTTTNSEDYDATSAGLLTEIVGGRQLTYNTAQQLVSADAIVGPDIEFAYDTAGRRTSSGPVAGAATTYGYDAAGYLATVTTPTTTVDYTTDARGLRQTRSEGSATDNFLWSTVGGLPLVLDDGDHSYIYGPSSTPIAQIDDDGTIEYLHTDFLGSVRLITDEDGDTAATATFDEFGARVNHIGTSDSAFGYTGAWTDADTGLVHLRARDYDPATGQFLTVDPAVDQTRQPYAYTGNNPLTRTDPTGLDWDESDWQNVGAVVAGVAVGIGVFAGIAAAVACTAATFGLCAVAVVVVGGAIAGAAAAATTYGLQSGEKSWCELGEAVGWGAIGGAVGGPVAGILAKVATPVVRAAISRFAGSTRSSVSTAGGTVNVSSAGRTAAEVESMVAYASRTNAWLASNGAQVIRPTVGDLRAAANAAVRQERKAAAEAGVPYLGQAGHVPDTAITGLAQPPAGWLDMAGVSNQVFGGALSSRMGQLLKAFTIDGVLPR